MFLSKQSINCTNICIYIYIYCICTRLPYSAHRFLIVRHYKGQNTIYMKLSELIWKMSVTIQSPGQQLLCTQDANHKKVGVVLL